MNLIEIFNEATCFIICIMFITYTDVTDNANVKNKIGYFILIVIFLNVGINMILVLYENIKALIKWIKKKCKHKD